MKTWKFGINNDKLVKLVLSGKKKATTCLYDKKDIPVINDESILVYSDGRKACITKTSRVVITEFKNITWDLARLEGEDDSFEDWKNNHIKFFKNIDKDFDENTKVVFEIFDILKIK